jgi:hypothetical protein
LIVHPSTIDSFVVGVFVPIPTLYQPLLLSKSTAFCVSLSTCIALVPFTPSEIKNDESASQIAKFAVPSTKRLPQAIPHMLSVDEGLFIPIPTFHKP